MTYKTLRDVTCQVPLHFRLTANSANLRYVTLRVARSDAERGLDEATSLPEAIKILRKQAGSHDKLAAELGTNRQAIIAWEKGRWPKTFLGKLRDRGVPDALLTPPSNLDELDDRARQIEAELVALREEIGKLR